MKNKLIAMLVFNLFVIKCISQQIAPFYVKSFDAENNIYQLKNNLLTDDADKRIKAGSILLANEVSLKLVKKHSDNLGTTHYKYQQYYKGIPIHNSDFYLHTNSNGLATVANGRLIQPFVLNTIPSISENLAINSAINADGSISYAWQNQQMEAKLKQKTGDAAATFFPTANLVIINIGLNTPQTNYKLAYKVVLIATNPHKSIEYFIDANNGSVLMGRDLTRKCNDNGVEHSHVSQNAKSAMAPPPCSLSTCDPGTANLLFYGNNKTINTTRSQDINNPSSCIWYPENNCASIPVQVLDQSVSNGLNTNNSNNWGNNFQTTTTSLFCAEKTVEYFKNIHNRNSYDNNSSGVTVYINFPGYTGTAAWDPSVSQILIGPSGFPQTCALTTLDVIGHEFTHGFTLNEASLNGFGEAGAIAESYSDIFGLMVDFYAKQNYTSLTPDWIYGNECMIGGQRNFANPTLTNQPTTYGVGPYWINPVTGPNSGGIHFNCAIQNLMFYLLSQGGSGVNDNNQNYCVTGIGRLKAAQIAYRVVTTYLTSTETFALSRAHWLLAASDLYGINSSEYVEVANAWHAVGVGVNLSPNIPIIVPTPMSLNYCQGEQIVMNGSQSTGSIISHYWKIEECTQNGIPTPSGSVWTGPILFTTPGKIDLLSVWPSMPCGFYYKVTLHLLNACSPVNTTSVVFYYNCGPNISFTGSTTYRCVGDPGYLSVVTTPFSSTIDVYQLPGNNLIYSGFSTSMMLTAPVTTTYKVVANNGNGCSVGYWTIKVSNCNREVDWSMNQIGLTGLWQVSGRIVDPDEGDVPDFEQAWYLQELDQDEEPIYTIINPACWQQDLNLPFTYRGFNPVDNNYQGEITNFNCTPEAGVLQSGHTYRLIRGAKNAINPYEEYSVILSPSQNLVGSGFDVRVENNNNRFGKSNTALTKQSLQSNKMLLIYPNPSNGLFNVNLPEIEGGHFIIYDVYGKKVLETKEAAKGETIKLDLSQFSKGIYLINLLAQGQIYSKRIIIE